MMAIGIWGFPTPATGGRSGWGQGLEMKKLASAIVALAALAASPAMAADMPVKYVPPAPPPVFSWSGCYIGVHVGAGWQVSSFAGGESSGGSVPASGVGWLDPRPAVVGHGRSCRDLVRHCFTKTREVCATTKRRSVFRLS